MSFASRCARWLLPLVALFASVAVQADTYDTATLVRIKTTSLEQVQVLTDERVDIVGRDDDVSYKALLTNETSGCTVPSWERIGRWPIDRKSRWGWRITTLPISPVP